MRSLGVIELAPAFDDDACLTQRAEPFAAKAFVAQLAVKAFAFAVLPRLARLDKDRPDAI